MLREADRLLERARDAYRRLQDAEVECADGAEPGRAFSTFYVVRDDLAAIARQFTRSQANLVHPDDPRSAAARQVVRYCDEAEPPGRVAA